MEASSAALGKVRCKPQRRSRKPKPQGQQPGQPQGPGMMSAGGPCPSLGGQQPQGMNPQGNPAMMGQPGQQMMNQQVMQHPQQAAQMGMQNMGMQQQNLQNYGGQMGSNPQNFGGSNPQNWDGNYPQQNYYNQMAPVARYERPQVNQSKQALSNMLRLRHPINQYIGGGGTPPMAGNYGANRQFPRQMRPQNPQQGQAGMFPQQYNMQNQSYAGYGAGGSGGMMNFQAGQFQGGNAGQGMMGAQRMAAGADGYMNPQQQQQRLGQNNRPQYLQAPNVTMNTMGGLSGNQGGPAPPYSRNVPTGGNPGVQQNQQSQNFQQVNHQRIRQQMMAMQQSGGGGVPGSGGGAGGGGNQPPPSALVAHLQRTMQQPNQQHNPYGHQPPQYQ